MKRCSWGVRLVGIASLAVGMAAVAAPPPPPRASPEPTKEALEPVQPDWEARGWKAVVPHAYVLKKLLPALEKPEAGAAPVFWLKGGTRVPVLVQGQEWWKISWTEGRAGWVRARDVEPHASFILIDTQTGRVRRRVAAKGQNGAISDGTYLWSIANTGLTRTTLSERPVFWSRLVAADRNAIVRNATLWAPDRSHFYVRAQPGETGPLLRVDVATGAIKAAGTPPQGDLAGMTPESRLLILEGTDVPTRTHLYDPVAGRTVRTLSTAAEAISQRGVSFHKHRRRLVRAGTDLRITHRIQLPAEIITVCLSVDQQFVAATCKSRAGRPKEGRYEAHLYRADTLQPVTTLQLPAKCDGYVWDLGATAKGWWLGTREAEPDGERPGEILLRVSRSGKVLGMEYGLEMVSSPDGKQVYEEDEEGLSVISTETGQQRTFPYTWRHNLPQEYLPRPQGGLWRREISSMTFTPDGRTLIVTEWLSGDPEA